jgi:dTDP-4-dehydrorhamnose 3,5-epimerase
MKITLASLSDVLIIEPNFFSDQRGFFMEMYHQRRYADCGIDTVFVQDNMSFSIKGTLRGLHYQHPRAQAKLVQVIKGEIFDVAIDIRRGSPTFAQWFGVHLTGESGRQLFIPEGFAHGFCVLSDTATVTYKCTDFYAPDDEGGILWSDPDLDINWPVPNPLLSARDSEHPCLCDVSLERLPVYKETT